MKLYHAFSALGAVWKLLKHDRYYYRAFTAQSILEVSAGNDLGLQRKENSIPTM